MKQYGCIGKKLTHSFSKEIHGMLADYRYDLIELQEAEIPAFFEKKAFAAINVTIPYKQTVIPYLDEISPIARRIGSVNTIVNKDGRLYGYNTDYYGMKALVEKIGVTLSGKKVLILGTGGTSKTANVLAQDLGAGQIRTVSRRKSETYITYEEALRDHTDAQVIINTTPAGMYPDCAGCPITLEGFEKLEGVVDVVYNPLRTNLVLSALKKGVKAEGGLFMLVMQAVVAAERFLDTRIPEDTARAVYAKVLAAKENIVLTGMPGSGKTAVGKLLDIPGFSFVDTDALVEAACGCAIKDLMAEKGEAFFRCLESQVVFQAAGESCRIISTGGGAVLREENVRALRQNGKIFFLEADLSRLEATPDRPLSDTREKLAKLYETRKPIYRATADIVVPDLPAQEAADWIKACREEQIL